MDPLAYHCPHGPVIWLTSLLTEEIHGCLLSVIGRRKSIYIRFQLYVDIYRILYHITVEYAFLGEVYRIISKIDQKPGQKAAKSWIINMPMKWCIKEVQVKEWQTLERQMLVMDVGEKAKAHRNHIAVADSDLAMCWSKTHKRWKHMLTKSYIKYL